MFSARQLRGAPEGKCLDHALPEGGGGENCQSLFCVEFIRERVPHPGGGGGLCTRRIAAAGPSQALSRPFR